MPQALLPLVPDGATPINDFFSVIRQNGQWTYFLGIRPVFQHAEEDQRSFRMFTAQLTCQGSCLQSEVVRTFGVSAISVKRSCQEIPRARHRRVLSATLRAGSHRADPGGCSASSIAVVPRPLPEPSR